jgi:hypothetical protein
LFFLAALLVMSAIGSLGCFYAFRWFFGLFQRPPRVIEPKPLEQLLALEIKVKENIGFLVKQQSKINLRISDLSGSSDRDDLCRRYRSDLGRIGERIVELGDALVHIWSHRVQQELRDVFQGGLDAMPQLQLPSDFENLEDIHGFTDAVHSLRQYSIRLELTQQSLGLQSYDFPEEVSIPTEVIEGLEKERETLFAACTQQLRQVEHQADQFQYIADWIEMNSIGTAQDEECVARAIKEVREGIVLPNIDTGSLLDTIDFEEYRLDRLGEMSKDLGFLIEAHKEIERGLGSKSDSKAEGKTANRHSKAQGGRRKTEP